MNIKILTATMVLLGAAAAHPALARDHGYERGHWSHDHRSGGRGNDDGHRGGGWRGGGHEYSDGRWRNDWRGGRRYDERRDWGAGRSHRRDDYWQDRGRDRQRREYWHHGYRPYRGYGSDYSYAPRYYEPYYYAPSFYAPGPWGGWFDDLGVVIQFNLR